MAAASGTLRSGTCKTAPGALTLRNSSDPETGVTYVGPRAFLIAFGLLCSVFVALVYGLDRLSEAPLATVAEPPSIAALQRVTSAYTSPPAILAAPARIAVAVTNGTHADTGSVAKFTTAAALRPAVIGSPAGRAVARVHTALRRAAARPDNRRAQRPVVARPASLPNRTASAVRSRPEPKQQAVARDRPARQPQLKDRRQLSAARSVTVSKPRVEARPSGQPVTRELLVPFNAGAVRLNAAAPAGPGALAPAHAPPDALIVTAHAQLAPPPSTP